MDHEEREEIPWSSLVAEMESGVDRRWWIAGGVGALLVTGFLALRFVGSFGGQPDIVTPPPAVTIAAGSTSTTTSASVTEADLRSTHEPSRERMAVVRAEWFVADYFTVDGSDETKASVRHAMGADLGGVALPHDEPGAPHTFVEWARALRVASSNGPVHTVDVAFRSIALVEGSFVRRPVRAVRVLIGWDETQPLVIALPEDLDDVWGES